MPVVPPRTVGAAPLPGVRVNPNVPVAAFPGAINARPDLSGVQRVVSDLHDQEIDRANRARVLDAVAQAGQAKSDLLAQVSQARGKDALGISDQIKADWQKRIGQIGGSLTPAQQEMFAAHATSEGIDLGSSVQRHVLAESERVAGEAYNARLEQTGSDAISHASSGDIGAVTADIGRRVQAVNDFASITGMPDEVRAVEVAKAQSQIHTSVIDHFLTVGDDLTAQAYYARHQDQIVGSDQQKIDGALATGSTLGAAQRAGDAITKSATTLTDALSKAGEIDNPKVREATERQIRQHFEDAAFADRQDREAAFDQAKEIVRQNGGDSTKVPPSLLNKLNTTQEEEVRRIGRNIRYPDHITDEAKYTNLLNFASVSPASFLDIDIRKEYGSDLSRNDLAHVEALQRKVREGQNRAESTADTRVKRGQEKVVLDQAKAAQKVSDNMKNLPADVSKFLPSPKPVTVPQWMLDSAKTNKPYADYLRMHGVNLDHAATTQAQPTAPRVPGGPLGPAKPIDLTKATP